MGNVYKARDRETGETVALKLLKPEIASDQAMMDRFKNELLFARKITHKNVCRVYEFNRLGGVAYTSMEFVEGESLRSVLNRFGALTRKKATDLALQICSGLKEAHAQGIVHRDLKPENVMIDTSGNLKIMDFGIARSMEAVTRHTGAMVGTPGLYGSRTGFRQPGRLPHRHLFARPDAVRNVHRQAGLHRRERHRRGSEANARSSASAARYDPSIPAHIERAILKCLEKSPRQPFSKRRRTRIRRSTIQRTAVGTASTARQGSRSSLSRSQTASARPSTAASAAQLKRSRPYCLDSFRRVSRPRRLVRTTRACRSAKLPTAFLRLPRLRCPCHQLSLTKFLRWPPPQPDDSAIQSAPPAKSGPEKPAAASSASASKPKPASPAEVFPRMEVAPRRNHPDPSKWIAAERAREAKAKHPDSSTPTSDKVYLRTGHFFVQREAQDQLKRIHDLGLPGKLKVWYRVKGNVYMVLCGPFAADGAKAVTAQLQSDGFKSIEKVSAASMQ